MQYLAAIRRRGRRLVHGVRRLAAERLGLWESRPRVLANSVPKSGTNMLSRCLELMPGMRNIQVYLNRPRGLDHLRKSLEQVYRGSFLKGHVIFTPEYYQLVQELGFSTILIIRDPRDVAVSLFHWITYIYKRHRLHTHFTSLADDSERLMAVICGVAPSVIGTKRGLEDVNEYVGAFMPWREHGSCLIRFENLVGAEGGGSRELQLQEIWKLASHLNVELTAREVERIADGVFYRRGHTFRKGQIGDWANHFSPEHREAFKEVAGRLLIDMGYESNLDW